MNHGGSYLNGHKTCEMPVLTSAAVRDVNSNFDLLPFNLDTQFDLGRYYNILMNRCNHGIVHLYHYTKYLNVLSDFLHIL